MNFHMDCFTALSPEELKSCESILSSLFSDIIPTLPEDDPNATIKESDKIMLFPSEKLPDEYNGKLFSLTSTDEESSFLRLGIQDLESLKKESDYFRGMLGGTFSEATQSGPISITAGNHYLYPKALALIMSSAVNPMHSLDIMSAITKEGSCGINLFMLLLVVGDYFQFHTFCKQIVKHSQIILRVRADDGSASAPTATRRNSIWQTILRTLPKVMKNVSVRDLESILDIAGDGLLKTNTVKDMCHTFDETDDLDPVIIPKKVWTKMIAPTMVLGNCLLQCQLSAKFKDLEQQDFFKDDFAEKVSSLGNDPTKKIAMNLGKSVSPADKASVEALLGEECKKKLLRDAMLTS